ncbi:MAG: S-layer homology domain-containing protein [Defluviitaleaceae bacterium]|nr:S-layer homology domain-containing protein [Defluviitaleaceae bacterium]
MKKFIAFCIAVVMMAGFALPVQGITFVNLFGYRAGEVVELRTWPGEGILIEIEQEDGQRMFFVKQPNTYLVGDEIAVGDFIVGHFGLGGWNAFMRSEAEVLTMVSSADSGRPDAYYVHLSGDGFFSPLTVDFAMTFFGQKFAVGDVVAFYHTPFGATIMYDMPQIEPLVIVNGDYEMFLGSFGSDGRLINSHRILSDEFSIYLNITDDAEVVTRYGEPFTGELTHLELAVVFGDAYAQRPPTVTPSKIIVINQPPPLTEPWDVHTPGGWLPPGGFGGTYVPDISTINWDFYPDIIWAREYINQALSLGLLPEELQGDLRQPLTRAEFAALAVPLYQHLTGRNLTSAAAFSDTSDPNILKMANLGVVEGVGGGYFNPQGPLTREQAATMLNRLATATQIPFATSLMIPPPFADQGQISPWALEAIITMQLAGIMGGVGNMEFDPQGSYTRAQGIASMMRLYNILIRQAPEREEFNWRQPLPPGERTRNIIDDIPEGGLSLDVISVTPQGITYYIVNPTARQYMGGRPFSLYKMNDGEWEKMPFPENTAFTMEGIPVMPHSSSTRMAQNFPHFFGELAPGQYSFRTEVIFLRRTGDFDVYVLSAEFEV